MEMMDKVYDHGYKTASGEVGTGWMRYIQQDNDPEDPSELASNWIETLQWEHETKDLLNESGMELPEFVEHWVNGFSDHVTYKRGQE